MTDVSREQRTAELEAVLFAMGSAVKKKDLCEALELSSEELEDLAAELNSHYEALSHGIRIISIEDGLQLCTKENCYEAVSKIAAKPVKPVLTDVMLEVLSIIAYKQPVTRSEIERIRGVQSDHAVNRMVEYGLIEEAGRLNAPGRPILFKTTENFLRAFGMSSLNALPGISEDLAQEARIEAYKEAGLELPAESSDEKEEEDGNTEFSEEESGGIILTGEDPEDPINVEI